MSAPANVVELADLLERVAVAPIGDKPDESLLDEDLKHGFAWVWWSPKTQGIRVGWEPAHAAGGWVIDLDPENAVVLADLLELRAGSHGLTVRVRLMHYCTCARKTSTEGSFRSMLLDALVRDREGRS